MLNKDSGTFLEFVGTRVSEIRTKSKVDTEWFWIPGELNPADMGTRPTLNPGNMGEESTYQKGFPWMYQPVKSWPVRKDFTPPPDRGMSKRCHAGYLRSRSSGKGKDNLPE
jgi:hypothetical protein